jgi:hypothetical protein
VGLERGPLSLVSTIEELLGRKSNGFGLESREYGRRRSVTLTTRHPLSAIFFFLLSVQHGSFCGLARHVTPSSIEHVPTESSARPLQARRKQSASRVPFWLELSAVVDEAVASIRDVNPPHRSTGLTKLSITTVWVT